MWREYLKIAGRALLANRLRSSLTVVSITIGSFSIVLMLSLAASGERTLWKSIEELGGSRLLLITSHTPERAERKRESYLAGMTLEDRNVLLPRLPHIERTTMFSSLGRRDVQGDTGKIVRSDFVASTSDFLDGLNLRLADGRMFSADEEARHAHLCLVGHKLGDNLWDGKAVGHTLTIAGMQCLVIGELADHDYFGMEFGFDYLDYVLMPRATAAEVQKEAIEKGSMLLLATDDPSNNDIVKRIANAILADRHHGVDDFLIYDMNLMMAKFKAVFGVMKAIVAVIASIALLVGGVGVMNMMLVSVSERVREIGIRKAIGASPRDIGAQFICEAVVLSSSGGLLGVTLGIGAAIGGMLVIHSLMPAWVGVVSVPAVVAALGVSMGVGLIFGYFPARRAGRMDAILAIRS